MNCCYCGQAIEPETTDYPTIHSDCRDLRRAGHAAAAIDRAEEVDGWDGWVYLEGVGPKDGYFESIEALVDWIFDCEEGEGDGPLDWPEYVFTCDPNPSVVVNADRIIENIGEDAYEDWDTPIKGVEEFKAACLALNEANKNQQVYHVNRKRVAKMPTRAECGAQAVNQGVDR